MICRPARWQRFDTVHSVEFEPGQLLDDRQTRPVFQKKNKVALRRANQKLIRQRGEDYQI